MSNETTEAYTGNHIGRKRVRTSLKQFSLDKSNKAIGEGLIFYTEAKTKEPIKARFWRDCRGLRAWHVCREILGTWETPEVPAKTGRNSRLKMRRSGYFWGVRSSIVLRGGREQPIRL